MKRVVLIVLMTTIWGCGTDDSPLVEEPAEHTESSDFEVVPDRDSKGDDVLPSFDRNTIVADSFYVDSAAVSAEELQSFFETSPYGNRSWLADFEVDGKTAAVAIAEAGQHHGVNPIMILVRMQVEQGLVSKTVKPSQSRVDRALGCGCPDGSGCARSYLGFTNQVECSGETHRKLYDYSVDRANVDWLAGKTRSTLDRYRVTPSNHASAALYGYTPWVLPNRGGNWLVWNIARKFVRHLESLGHYTPTVDPFVGAVCATDEDCGFVSTDGANGFCHTFQDTTGSTHGFCTLACQGYCPDKSGWAPTFCVDGPIEDSGMCVSQAVELNESCTSIPGTRVEDLDRYIGTSSASARTSTVCAPDLP